MRRSFLRITPFALALIPAFAFAQDNKPLGQVSDTFNNILSFINQTLIPLVFAIALLVFLYGIFKYFIAGGGDESKRAEGRQLMLYSVIGFVVMVSIFAVVNIVQNGFGLNQDNQLKDLPGINKTSNN